MMRVPVSALRPCQALRGVNASANPSVTRVELKTALDARRFARLLGLSGSGDPLGPQMILEEKLPYRPGLGFATASCVSVSEIRLAELNPIKAWMELFASGVS